jgi:Dna[CI] antecedent, DciA
LARIPQWSNVAKAESRAIGMLKSELLETRIVEHVASGLEKILTESLRQAPQGEATLLAWPLVCGSRVAERARAFEFANSVLLVEVPDTAWKQELQNLAPRYLAALNRYTVWKVERIDFVIRPAQSQNS